MIKIWNKTKLNKKFTIILSIIVVIPIICLSAISFFYIENSILNGKKQSMKYTVDNYKIQISENINTIELATKLILNNRQFITFMEDADENKIETKRLLEFHKNNIGFLEQMINSNVYLSHIRIYIQNKNIPELMPIIYYDEKMKNFDYKEKNDKNYLYNYNDSLAENEDNKKTLMGKFVPIKNAYGEQIATLEVAMDFEHMFSEIYEENPIGCNILIDDKGETYYNKKILGKIEVNTILENIDLNENNVKHIKINKRNLIIGILNLEDIDSKIICINDITSELQKINITRTYFMTITIILLVFFIVIINFVVRVLLKKFYNIYNSINKVKEGNLDEVLSVTGDDEMDILSKAINEMLLQIKVLIKENVDREILTKNAEIKSLQNQINAHFIHNTLENIKMLAEIEEKFEISDSITSLGKLLRYTMKWTSSNVTLKEELNYIENYVKLIKLRFNNDVNLRTNIPDELYTQIIPKMSLQPIVENAIYHGIENLGDDATIIIKVFIEDNKGIIEISDNGIGMTDKEVSELYKKINTNIETNMQETTESGGIGLKNVQDRIKMTFGDEYGIEIISKKECFTKIKVIIPITVGGNH